MNVNNLIIPQSGNTDYNAIAYDAYKGISECGATCTLSVATKGTYDPVTDTYATHATFYHTYALLGGTKLWKIDKSLVDTGEQIHTIPAYGLPRLDDMDAIIKIIIGNVAYLIEDIKAVEPGNVALLFKCTVRE